MEGGGKKKNFYHKKTKTKKQYPWGKLYLCISEFSKTIYDSGLCAMFICNTLSSLEHNQISPDLCASWFEIFSLRGANLCELATRQMYGNVDKNGWI